MRRFITTKNFKDISRKVAEIKATENSYYVSNMNSVKRRKLLDVNMYSPYGLTSAGTKLGFPAQFVGRYGNKHPDGAKKILSDSYQDMVDKMTDEDNTRGSKRLFVRDFNGLHCAILTDRYSVFDDDEIIDILSQNEYLMDSEEFWYSASPERMHIRFISKNKLFIPGDTSPLSMCVFVDNSMCGTSSFRIRFGLYRWACTNGMIVGLKEFEIIREKHMGEKEYVQIVAKALDDVKAYEDTIIEIAKEASVTKSKIYNLDKDQALAYLEKKLQVGKKGSEEIFEIYHEYGGKTKWHLVNAITDYAHKESIETRVLLEEKALKVA